MAEAVLTVLLENLNSMIQKEFGLVWGVSKEMEKLTSILSTICAVLEDAEERQLRDKAIKNWLRKLKDVSEELDDILNECGMEASQMEYKRQKHRTTQMVQPFVSCFNPINTFSRLKIAKKLKGISYRLDEIAKERLKFHLHELVRDERSSQIRDIRQTSSIVDQQNVYGREEDKDRIVEFLVDCNSSNCRDLSVYPIVGMGGMGKTTLAQLVFNDERVSRHFDAKIWVCVSEDFDVKRLTKAIIESATGRACDALDTDPLQKRLQNLLEWKKFVLVLDDVWNEDQEQWERLRNVLSCGLSGSSIVVTTRLKKVASIMGTIPMHQLSILSEDDCWLLFKQRAFGDESEERPNLVKIGKKIVQKCGGVPLAAKTLGSLMHFERDEKEWLFVMESRLWNLQQDEISILPALRLSYFHLPIEFRRCFAYCAIFPKNFIIFKERLIHLWIANDLISPKGNMDVEDIGNKICNELYWRSFFQDVMMDEFGNLQSFKMHDLVHDLAQSIMEDECGVIDIDNPNNFSQRVRHLTCTYSDRPFGMLSTSCKIESLRTLMLLSPRRYWQVANEFANCFHFHSLRAFVANDQRLPPTSISFLMSNLKHLRYLNISNTSIKVLPESICSLQSLLTLDVTYCLSLEKLPEHLSCLRSLRHLYIKGCILLHQMPPNIGKLTCLRTLSCFIVNSRSGRHVDELGSLNLCGELQIFQLEKVSSPMEAKNSNLARKMNLKSLCLSWSHNESSDESSQEKNHELVLEALEAPPTLRILEIVKYKGRHFPHWLSNALIFENVVRICLDGCKNCLELPTALGKLPLLRHLVIFRMDLLRYVDYGEPGRGSFLSLKSLTIFYLANLEGLSRLEERTEIFPGLTDLLIGDCSKLTLRHCLQSINVLNVRGCNEELLKSLSNLQTLTSLEISYNDDLVFFPHGVLQNFSTSLKRLQILGFKKLQHLHSDMLIGLSALEELHIISCHELEHFPKGIFRGLNMLKTMEIEDCSGLKSFPADSFEDLAGLENLQLCGSPELEVHSFPHSLQHLSSLKDLKLSGRDIIQLSRYPHKNAPKLTALPEALQHLPSLQYLTISQYPNLGVLPEWLGNLTSLNSLSIKFCPKLASLPTSVQQLTNLQVLEISRCPKLEQRCEKDSGEDWHKIAHIPHVRVWNSHRGQQ
ncbi:hypothetical protein FNV43_RR10104 [Rhamnella rubrinervis]|uniref:Disease resistance protein RGA3 n=1 Tax=Rhamnella rubrinervis TaxID=2594499 RepID=A0A8K0MKE2_9ROSA|nr:hypothetical protein FNV43_RR10104 [Rhamnella rubrinervis]